MRSGVGMMQSHFIPKLVNGIFQSNHSAVCTLTSRFTSSWFGDKRGDRTADIEEVTRSHTPPSPPKQPHSRKSASSTGLEKFIPSVTCSDRRFVPRQAWLESMDVSGERYLDIIDLHPDVFATFPRLDIVHRNLYWQANYRVVDWRCIVTRSEMVHRSRRKPWPQKGTGRARHGSRRSHIFIGGAQCNGPRGPHSYYSLLPFHLRLRGLLSMLTVKHAQGDLHIVEDFSLSPELESEAAEIYRVANRRALDRLRLAAGSPEVQEDDLVARLGLETPVGEETPSDVLSAAVARDKEATEELLDLVRGGRAAAAASLGFRAARCLRNLVDERGWGPSTLFVTDIETYLGEKGAEPSSGLAMALACASYAHYIEADVAPEAAAIEARLREGAGTAAPRAQHPGRGLTLMPVSGLNVWSMVTHAGLVVTRAALDRLTERLLRAQRLVQTSSPSAAYTAAPAVGDWLVGRDLSLDAADGATDAPTRHFSAEQLGDFEELRRRLQ